MGNKIITEKDFWMCSCGAVPAQFQSTQKTVKKKSGEKFITIRDTATSSWIDFGCTRMMLIMAIIAAAVVVIAAMTVATGGAALIALGAIAGLAGAAWGAVLGTLLCGQLAAKARKWVGSKNNYIVQGVETITGDHTMTCPVGGKITYAPQIKNWSQAIALGAGNYIGHLMEGMMAGAAIGMGGALISGGAGAFASGGIRGVGQAAFQFAKSAPMNVIRNIGATFGYAGAGASTSTVVTTAATAVGLRGVTATQAGLQHYGSTGESGWGAAGRGVFAMEEGMYHSGGNILSGNAGWQDVTGLALLLSPVHRAPDELNGRNGKPVKDGEAARDGETAQDGEQKKAEDENVRDASTTPEETAKKDGEGEAYEATPLKKPNFNEFVNSVEGGFPSEIIAKKAYELFNKGDWQGLENLFNQHNINGGWPPNRGATGTSEVSLKPNSKFDRYGGWIDENGKFQDKGTFVGEDGIPYTDRALPKGSDGKPYRRYEVINEIPGVKKGDIMPWFGEKGGGVQYELPANINDLIKEGYIKPLD
ncbi:TNT domain-containing protein [Pedobacter rhodius]|uniref:TNT domain-containing protein n=1 Tax=Pedobacter rhodius TaxID=3004098 RepID=A0ABT4KZ24_9SPHI|nr:TNT domain-containing protein [Pedobacter sp. SJ11]MCZ4223981.1 TNT domain-containing protein [Pedobacter sp. SJ11]